MGDTRLLPALKKTGKRTDMSSLESLGSGEATGVNYGNAALAEGNGRSLERKTSQQQIAEEADGSSVAQTPRTGRGKGKGEQKSNASEKPEHRGSVANASVEGSIKSAA